MEKHANTPVGDDSLTKHIQPFRDAQSPTERVEALRQIESIMETLTGQEKEQLSYCLMRETPSFVEGSSEEEALFECLAGHETSISAAVRILQDISTSNLDSLAALELALSVLRNVLCSRPKETNDAQEWLSMLRGGRQETIERWVSLVLRLPGLVANACKKLNVAFPLWSVQGKYLPRIIECALSLRLIVSEDSWKHTSQQYLFTLTKSMLRRGGDEVTKGLYQVYERHGSSKEFHDIVAAVMRDLSPREFAILSRSMILHIISMHPKQDFSNHCSRYSHPFLEGTVRKIVSRSNLHADSFVQFLIFSAGYNVDGNYDSPYVIASILADIDSKPFSADFTDSDDEDDTPALSPRDILLRRQLIAVIDRWSRPDYVLDTPNRQQAYVTAFIRVGMQLLCQSKEDAASELVAATLEGVTCRLSSTDPGIRRNGMQVAVLLAHRLGEKLEFDELNHIEADTEAAVETTPVDERKPTTDADKRARKSQRLRFKNVDPDAPYTSDDEDSALDDDSDDSSWDDEYEESPFDLDDDEEDLADTAKPRFLSDCLDLLRTPETDENACSRHETALTELSRLVRSRPMDLSDIAATIAFELVHMENKFDIKGFADSVASSLRSLAVEEPLLVGETLMEEVFQDVSLADRLSAMRALSEAAYELAGLLAYEEQEISRNRISGDETTVPTLRNEVSKGHELRKVGLREVSTRRWGYTRAPKETFRNSFANIAPIWFYSLVRKFLERKEDTRLWKGTIGATFLATIFQTLSAFVECSRYDPGTSVLARDLIQLVWGFNHADVGEVRTAVLLAVSVSFRHLGTDDALHLLLDGNMPEALHLMASTDPDDRCRELAAGLMSNITKTIDSMSIRPLAERN